MKRPLLSLLFALLAFPAWSQIPGPPGLVVGNGTTTGTVIQGGTSTDCLTVGSGNKLTQTAGCGGSGIVSSFSAGTTGFTPSSATTGAVTLAGTLIAANGGTGFASYAVGDLLYAATTTTLAKLADVATTNVLLSGGIGAAPAWGKVALTALATQATNTVLGNATSGTAVPTALAIGSCSAATSALTWTTNSGFGCNTLSSTYLPLAGGTMTGGIGFSTTNTLDIGTSATVLAPRTVYAGTSFVGPVGTFTTSSSLAAATATTVAVGGATIGSNALAVTGTSLFTGVPTFVGDPLITTAASASITFGGSSAASGQGVVKYNAATDQFEVTATRSNGSSGDVVLRVANSTVVFSALRNGSVALGTAADVIMSRAAAANLQLGAAAVDTAPVAQTLSVQNVLAGGTSNVAGANFTINGSQGKGTGAGGSIIFQVAPAGSTGTAVNALATALTIPNDNGAIAGAGGFKTGNYFSGSNSGTRLYPDFANGAVQILKNTAIGVTLDAATDATLKLFARDGTTAATITAGAATFSGVVIMSGLGTDAGTTDNNLCLRSDTKAVVTGTGTLGICLGTSSARYKHDIGEQVPGLDKIAALRPVSYRYNAGYGDGGRRDQLGFLAEDVIDVLPGLVGLDMDGRPNTVDMLGMVPIMAKAIRELKIEIDEMRAAKK